MKKTLLTGLLALSTLAYSAKAVTVGLELALLVDVSGSVDATEYGWQKGGYAQAFQSASVHNLISQVPGGIAVSYTEWSSAGSQSMRVGWTLITDAASANAFSATLTGLNRLFGGSTAPGNAINFVTPTFTGNGFEGDRLVIDVSGDGQQNDGANTAAARNAALLAGIDRINGLAITTDDAGLAAWYAANIQGGANSFTLTANNAATFASAIETKIRAEITNTNPVPDGGSSFALLGLATLALACVKRNLKKA